MNLSFRAALLLSAVLLGALPCFALEWPHPVWSPEMGLDVRVEEFSVSEASLLTALSILDNETGLVFGIAARGRINKQPADIALHMRDATVRETVAALEKQANGYTFETIDGVVVAAALDSEGHRPPFLDHRMPSFRADQLDNPALFSAMVALLKQTPGVPALMATGGWDDAGVEATFSLQNPRVVDVLCRASACTNETWMYFEQPELGRASFGMGRECMLEWGTQFVARLAPGAPREPLPDRPPSREAVQQRVDEAVRNGRLRLHQLDAAAADLCGLLEDRLASQNVLGMDDVIKLLGSMRSADAAPIVVRNIVLSGSNLPNFREFWNAGRTEWPQRPDPRERAEGLYRYWLRHFAAVEALISIGEPSVQPVLRALAETDPQPPADAPKSLRAREDPETRIILLCETLSRIRGVAPAVADLRAAAAQQEDPEKAARLNAAAGRIEKGLIPEL